MLKKIKGKKLIRKAVIPVAGFGTRFLPMTIAQPKEMLPIVDKPIIQYLVEEMVAAGIEEIIFVTGRNKRAIEDHFDYSGELEQLLRENNKLEQLKEVHRISQLAKFVFVRQNKMLGNGHALMMAREVIDDEPFVLCWGDDVIESRQPAIGQLIDAYKQHRGSIIGVMPVKPELACRYGIVRPAGRVNSKTFRISGLVEKPPNDQAPSPYGIFGRYVLTPRIFHWLEKTKPTPAGEIFLTDALNMLARREPTFAHLMRGRYWDCGNKVEYIKANIHYALANPKWRPELIKFMRDSNR